MSRGQSRTRGGADYCGKRLLDLAVVAVAAVPALIVGCVCGLAIKTTSDGPVFFRQDRVGRSGQRFRIWKFRTMIDGDNPVIPADDRITAVGRVLRRTSLDELPQLLNVLQGHMSIVGPRPTLPYQAERWSARQRRRLDQRPGLTGLAQVSGRNDLSWDDRIELDLRYIARSSLGQDLRIITRTARTLWSGQGTGATAVHDRLACVGESP